MLHKMKPVLMFLLMEHKIKKMNLLMAYSSSRVICASAKRWPGTANSFASKKN